MFTRIIQRRIVGVSQSGWRRVAGLAIILAFLPIWPVFANDAVLQLPKRPAGRLEDINRNLTLTPDRRVYLTYGGDVIFRFPNYSIRVFNFRDGSIPGEGRSGVIFHNDAGMYWDGQGLIVTPNYSWWLLTDDRYARGVVGNPQTYWPWLEPRVAEAVELREKLPLEFPPLVGYRSLEEPRVEGFAAPDHGPLPQAGLVAKPYVVPLKPKLGEDGQVYYVPSASAIQP
jgi:hypothetical protein